jgi:hypothetical protein
MADRQMYLENNDDQISAQKRMEQQGTGVLTASLAVAGLVAITLAKKKINLSKAFSSEIRSIRQASGTLSKYVISDVMKSGSIRKISEYKKWAKSTYEALKAPIPTGLEQLSIAMARTRVSASSVPRELLDTAQSQTRLGTFFHGPLAAIAPTTPVVMPGKRYSSGKYGAIAGGGNLFVFGQKGRLASVLPGVRVGLMGSPGSRLELLRAFKVKEYRDLRSFTKGVLTPLKRDMLMEHKRMFAEEYLGSKGIALNVSKDTADRDVLSALSEQIDRYSSQSGGPTASKFFKTNKDAISNSYKDALNKIVEAELKKPYANKAYKLYKLQMRLGVGEPFAGFESGYAQKKWSEIREALEMRVADPLSGRNYKVRGRRYLREGESLSGMWGDNVPGKFYAFQAGGEAKRLALSSVEGTFFRTLEQITGFGISASPNKMTSWVSSMVGASPGSYGEFAIRRYAGGFGRLAVLGVGGYTAFKLVNYLARQATGGWGVTDVAGKMYTTAREFQQHVIDQAGLVKQAKGAESLFPGIIKSPLASLARATAPYWMMKAGKHVAGKRGAITGLALGIAVALITWGDITQSPEELHKIYTGEQDIPVRKGRYWMFGKTPFGGGKIQYWRPHWYPMLRSKYKHRGQLWDPYYWEKKHYKDRPYPLTGELFEPTMPFAWLGNATIGNLVKPQRSMHPEYEGYSQEEVGESKTIAFGAGAGLGMGTKQTGRLLPNVYPNSPSWIAGEAAYTLSEQMGLSGFLASSIFEKATGRQDFMATGPIAQSARRATGYERAYWEMNLGDPFNTTEFARRVLPHRRRGIEEYNPIANTMPDWIPGEENYINFRSGDPYTKVEMGEARLPGAGYESLHRLHSGIPKVYDAVDRFLILSDIAPYSKEYGEYRILAQSMTRKEPYWSEVVKKHLEQRSKTQEDYEFLDLKAPEGSSLLMGGLSSAYRHVAAGITGAGSVAEPFLSAYTLGGVLFAPAFFPIQKFFPYKTARQAYKEYRLYGSEFTDWGNPFKDFVQPYVNKVIGVGASMVGVDYVPPEEKKRSEYSEYFDKLQYVKYKNLQNTAEGLGDAKLAKRMKSMASRTLTGMDPTASPERLMSSIPKRERAFVGAFVNAEGNDRGEILSMVSPQMAQIYEAQWAMKDGGRRTRVRDDEQISQDLVRYFGKHAVPDEGWGGWHPEVDIKDAQLKVVRNEGMDIHNFDLWESQERSMYRRPQVSAIPDINQPTGNLERLKAILHAQLTNDGYTDARMYVTQTPSRQNTARVNLKIKRNRDKEVNSNVRSLMHV